MGHDSYEVDIPNGGVGVVMGNVIEKGPNADNPTLLAYGEEGIDNPGSDLYVVDNTFVNDFTSGTFISVAAGGTLTAHNNILYGPGTPSSTGALSADNLTGTDPLFVAPADLRLSPAGGLAGHRQGRPGRGRDRGRIASRSCPPSNTSSRSGAWLA